MGAGCETGGGADLGSRITRIPPLANCYPNQLRQPGNCSLICKGSTEFIEINLVGSLVIKRSECFEAGVMVLRASNTTIKVELNLRTTKRS